MNPMVTCGAVELSMPAMLRRAMALLMFFCFACALARPARAQADAPADQQQAPRAQADTPADQRQAEQAQRDDLAAEIEELRHEIADIKAQLARLTALQRAQTERLLLQPQQSTVAALPTEPQVQHAPQRPTTAAAVPAFATAGESGTPTIFVFKDGNRTEAHNFAIVGGTLWIYTDQDAKKYAVSYIDVPATTAANAARGNKFQMPETK